MNIHVTPFIHLAVLMKGSANFSELSVEFA